MRKAEKHRLALEKREKFLEAERALGRAALEADLLRRAESKLNPFEPSTKPRPKKPMKPSRVESDQRINVRR